MKILREEQIKELKDKFIGKHISVIGDGGRFVGTCDFIGYSHFESWGLQVTIDRMPVSNVKIKSVHLVEILK
jgi:hypothetical protein